MIQTAGSRWNGRLAWTACLAILSGSVACVGQHLQGDRTPGTLPSDAATESVVLPGHAALIGTPDSQAVAGKPYAFAPTLRASSPGFAFSVANKPAWALFSTVTGELSGTPGDAHVGTERAIRISASNGAAHAALPAFDITVAHPGLPTGTLTLSWAAPREDVEGLPLETLAGYVIYHGTSPGDLRPLARVDDPDLRHYTFAALTGSKHWFGISAYTTSGVESAVAAVEDVQIM